MSSGDGKDADSVAGTDCADTETGEPGRLGMGGGGVEGWLSAVDCGGTAAPETARGIRLDSSATVRVRTGVAVVGDSGIGSGEVASRATFVGSLFNVDCRDVVDEVAVGVGDRTRVNEGFSGRRGGRSGGDGRVWMTLVRSLLVRTAADWIMGT